MIGRKLRLVLAIVQWSVIAIGLAACSSEEVAPEIEVLDIGSAPGGSDDADCDFALFEKRLDELVARHPERGYDLALSTRLYARGDPALAAMRSTEMRDRFISGQEAMVLQPENGGEFVIARFADGLNAERSVVAHNECREATGAHCHPIMYYDGLEAFCLGTTEEDYVRQRTD